MLAPAYDPQQLQALHALPLHCYDTRSAASLTPLSAEITFVVSSSQRSCTFNPVFTQCSEHFELDVQSLPGLLSPKPLPKSLTDLPDGGGDDEDEDEDVDMDDDFETFTTPAPYPNAQKHMYRGNPPVALAPSQDILSQNLHHDVFTQHSHSNHTLDLKSSHLHMQLQRPAVAISMAENDFYQHWSIQHHFHAKQQQPLISLTQPISPPALVFDPSHAMADPISNDSRPLGQTQETVNFHLDAMEAQTQLRLFHNTSSPVYVSDSDLLTGPLSPILDILSSGISTVVESSWTSPPPLCKVSLERYTTVDKKQPMASERRSGSTCHQRGIFQNARAYNKTASRAFKIEPVFPNCSNHKVSEVSISPSCSSTSKRKVRHYKARCKPTTFVCDAPSCGKTFSRAYNLTSHMKTHSTDRPFLCGACPLAFARRHDRERHARLHTGERPYSCENCSCGFMRNDALHRHQRICGDPARRI